MEDGINESYLHPVPNSQRGNDVSVGTATNMGLETYVPFLWLSGEAMQLYTVWWWQMNLWPQLGYNFNCRICQHWPFKNRTVVAWPYTIHHNKNWAHKIKKSSNQKAIFPWRWLRLWKVMLYCQKWNVVHPNVKSNHSDLLMWVTRPTHVVSHWHVLTRSHGRIEQTKNMQSLVLAHPHTLSHSRLHTDTSQPPTSVDTWSILSSLFSLPSESAKHDSMIIWSISITWMMAVIS